MRIGRATKLGWEIPWDPMISREHADFSWGENRLHVKCLEQARNPLHYRGQPIREVKIGRDEWFQIGRTTHDQVMRSIEIVGEKVIPRFTA